MEKSLNEMVIEELENEIRNLQGTSNMNGDLNTAVAPSIVDRLESISFAYFLARKIYFEGQFLNVPIEGNLDAATFVTENQAVQQINLYLNGNTQLRGDKRVGVSVTISKNALSNSSIDLKEYIEDLIIERIGTALEQSIFNGSGDQLGFHGIAKDDKVVSSPLTSGAATIDQLRDVQNLVHELALADSVWYMNRKFFNEVSKLKDNNDRYHLKYENGVPILLGHVVEITGGLADDSTSGNIPVVFGSIGMGYTVGITKDIDVQETTGSTDSYQGTVTYTADMLIDGGVTNYQVLAVGKVS